MLPSELLIVRRRKGRIWPRYAKISGENTDVAKLLIETYKQSIGNKKHTIKRAAEELEDMGYDYRFVRGLSTLLERRSTFECRAQVDPLILRRKLFQAASESGIPVTRKDRNLVLQSVSSALKITPEMADESIYADMDNELLLTEFDPPSTDDLLKDYNLSLTQTLLFNSTEISFSASGNWQAVFRTIKRLGLIYHISREGQYRVRIDGPSNLFKLTRRYGTALAKLVPAVISAPPWVIEATILWRYTNELCSFKIESWKHGRMLKKPPQSLSYDSKVEESFAARFKALNSSWRLKREPEPVPVGNTVLIPDFSFESKGVKILMEIVGFWTVEYLTRKIEKLKQVDVDMIVAVDENLACERVKKLIDRSIDHDKGLQVFYFKKKVPLSPVVQYLEKRSEQGKKEETTLLQNLSIEFTDPVVIFKEFANRIGVSTESVRKLLFEKHPEDYVVLPNCLVRTDIIRRIELKLKEQWARSGSMRLSEAASTVESEGVFDAPDVLRRLGYRIIWRGITPESAEVLPEAAEKVVEGQS